MGYRGLIAVVLGVLAFASPASSAAPTGKLTVSELNGKSAAGNKLHAAIDAAITEESGVLGSLCDGIKQHPSSAAKAGFTRVAQNLKRSLSGLKTDAKKLQTWADGLDARADHYGDAADKQLVKEASASLLVGFSQWEDAIGELETHADQLAGLECHTSFLKPLNHLDDGTTTATRGFEKLLQALHKGF